MEANLLGGGLENKKELFIGKVSSHKILITKGKRLLYSGEPWQTSPNQLTRVHTGSNRTDGQNMTPDRTQ